MPLDIIQTKMLDFPVGAVLSTTTSLRSSSWNGTLSFGKQLYVDCWGGKSIEQVTASAAQFFLKSSRQQFFRAC